MGVFVNIPLNALKPNCTRLPDQLSWKVWVDWSIMADSKILGNLSHQQVESTVTQPKDHKIKVQTCSNCIFLNYWIYIYIIPKSLKISRWPSQPNNVRILFNQFRCSIHQASHRCWPSLSFLRKKAGKMVPFQWTVVHFLGMEFTGKSLAFGYTVRVVVTCNRQTEKRKKNRHKPWNQNLSGKVQSKIKREHSTHDLQTVLLDDSGLGGSWTTHLKNQVTSQIGSFPTE